MQIYYPKRIADEDQMLGTIWSKDGLECDGHGCELWRLKIKLETQREC